MHFKHLAMVYLGDVENIEQMDSGDRSSLGFGLSSYQTYRDHARVGHVYCDHFGVCGADGYCFMQCGSTGDSGATPTDNRLGQGFRFVR